HDTIACSKWRIQNMAQSTAGIGQFHDSHHSLMIICRQASAQCSGRLRVKVRLEQISRIGAL
ncbi:MAG: hypothetical protein ACXWQO_10310, partial [Bdellovibrionota bacterium]